MKRGRLPLTALRSFEAAGRHLSFSRAAEELFVSQAAISRQVRELEETIGRPLFARLHRKVELTDIGHRLLAQLTQSFDEIDRRLSEVIAPPSQHLLKISVEPFFASGWLLPRLVRFREARPEVDVVVDVSGRLADFRADDTELAIRFSADRTGWPDTRTEHLVAASYTPLISPALLSSGPPLRQPADILRHTLLHDESRNGWVHWLMAAGQPGHAADRGPMFPDGALGVQAAILGHGVVLGDAIVNAEDIRLGKLVKPFELEVHYGEYWVVSPDFRTTSKPARAFSDWLHREISEQLGARI